MIRQPNTLKKFHSSGQDDKIAFTCGQMQGWRPNMEDAYLAVSNLGDGNSLFAVFDGHGGKEISSFLQGNFVKTLLSLDLYQQKSYQQALEKCFQRLDELIMTQTKKQEMVLGGQKQLIPTCLMTGSTANVLLITQSHYFIANCGDSRSALKRGNATLELSFDHKPNNQLELSRIEKAGGHIQNGRVNGNLNLSRAFGDFMYKTNLDLPYSEQIVTCKPDIKVIERNKAEDKFILMGCDGIWQRYEGSSCGLLEVVNSDLKMKRPPKAIVEDLLNLLLSKNILESKGKGCDNMTVLLILLAI